MGGRVGAVRGTLPGMHPLRPFLLAACLLAGSVTVGAVSLSACAQPAVPSSDIAAAQAVAATAATVVDDAEALWPVVYTLIPPAQQSAALSAFNAAIFAANHSILALDDLIQAAIAIGDGGAPPNLTAAISDVASAVAAVIAVVDQFNSLVVGDAGGSASADIHAAAARLKARTAH